MKALKIAAIALTGLVLLVVLVVALALTPAVQTWAVRRAVAGQPGITIELGRVSAGFTATEISDLRVAKDGLIVTASRVSARYSAWDYLTHKRVNVDEVSAQGLLIDARRYAPAATPAAAPATAAAAPFPGVMSLAQLPLEVRLGRLAVGGQALLPGERTVNFDLRGGGIETGQRGKLEWQIAFADPAKSAALRALRATGSLSAHIATDRRIDTVEVENTAAVEGPSLPADRVRVEAKAEQPAAGANEVYTASASLLRQEKAEQVFNARAEFLAAQREFTGTWAVAVRSEQLAALLAGFGLPEVALDGKGQFTFKPDNNAATASGEITGRVSALEKLSPQLAAVGAVQWRAAFEGGLADDVARLGRLEIEAAGADGRKLLQVAAAQPVSFNVKSQRLEFAQPGSELARVTIAALPLAWAQPAIKPVTIERGDLSGAFAVEAEPDGREARVRTIQPLTLSGVTVSHGAVKLVEQMTLALSPRLAYSLEKAVVEVPDLKLTTPAGDTVDGKISAEIAHLATTPVITFSAEFNERLVGVLRPYLPLDPGPLTVASTVAGRLEGQTLQLDKFTTMVQREGGALFVAAETLQPVTADFATVRTTAKDAAAPAARVRVGTVPLALAEGFVAKSKFAGSLDGAVIDILMPAKDRMVFQTSTPLAVRGAGVTLDGQALAQGLDADLDFTATKSDTTAGGELRRLEIRQGSTSLVKLNASGEANLTGKFAVTAKGKIETDLAALMRQPVFASSPTVLARGNLTVDFDATTGGDAVREKIAVAARNLVAKQGNQPLGDFDAALAGELKTDLSSGKARLPVSLTVGDRRSDLTIDGEFERRPAQFVFNGKLASAQLIADDFKALAALAPQTPAANAPAATQSQPKSKTAVTATKQSPAKAAPAEVEMQPDAAPFWKAVAGRFEMDLKKVQYGRDYTATDIKGLATITDTRLALDNLEGRLKENPFKITAGLSFAAKQAKPYTLDGVVNVPGLDLGALLRAVNPNDPPSLESNVTITGKFAGQGATLDDLAQNAYGQFDVTGTKGVLRALSNKGGSTAAGLASGALRLFGAIKGSDTATALGEFTDRLREMPFDQFSLHAERSEDLNLKLTKLEFLSPETHLTGSGSITYQKGVEIVRQPLHVELQLAGKTHMATILRRLYLLDAKQDAKGYTLMTSPFVLNGSIAKPDSSQLWKIAAEAAARGLLR